MYIRLLKIWKNKVNMYVLKLVNCKLIWLLFVFYVFIFFSILLIFFNWRLRDF